MTLWIPWTLPCLVLLIDLRRAPVTERGTAIAPGLVWLLLFLWTGDRRLYFCYSMQYAVYALCLRLPLGLTVAALFLAVRVLQGATAAVLLVEVAVAAAVLLVSEVVYRGGKWDLRRRIVISMAGSLLAFAGLAL